MKYDCIIIGGGPAGYKAAEKLTDLKKSVCIIEANQNHIGGTCLNVGCIPVKSLFEIARVYDSIKNSSKFGITSELKPPDMEKIFKIVKNNIFQIKTGLLSLLKNKDIDIVFGKASFISEKIIEVDLEKGGKEKFEADNFILATGSSPKKIPDIETDGKYICNSSQIIQADLPKSLLIAGGGYIGSEFASIYNKLGAKVTIVEECEQILPYEDTDVSKTLQKEFKKQGIEVLTSSKIANISKPDSGVVVTIKQCERLSLSHFDRVLISVGRIPNTKGLNLEKINIHRDNGFIKVDDSFRTNIDHIFAVGDVIDTGMFAHTAIREGIIAAEELSGINKHRIDYNAAPRIIFTSPQVGCLGITENKAKEKGLNIGISKNFFKANAKAILLKETGGFAKIIFDVNTHKILGVCIIGPDAPELIHGAGFPGVYAHPTLSEILEFNTPFFKHQVY